MPSWFKIETYVPADYVRRVKSAMADAGAGRGGTYDRCFWETEGTGQFRPLTGSSPFVGIPEEICLLREIKLETICTEAVLGKVLSAIRDSHPYEKPAVNVMKLEHVDP